ncbi:MAG: type II secretion system protein [Tepidisphaeraceae bacterium]
MNDSSRIRRRESGFTLVELLVVIGIIAVLISILLPTLSAARKQANQVKCMSQLREIGAALNFYAGDNKGYWPVVRHEADAAFPPSSPSLRSVPARNDYWYQFLFKYFTKKQYTNLAGQRLNDFMKTPLWGCPQVEKSDADATTSTADFNSGYGMAPYASYTETRWFGANSAPAGIVKGSHWAMISSSSGGLEGRYFKQTEWTRPALRGIIADSRSWFMETRAIAVGGQPTPQVKGTMGYDGAASDQFDRYRHGAGNRGKKIVAFNMLFCDGHVATLRDITDGYRAIRMKFPG